MSLTEVESRSLAEMSTALQRTDPGLARELRRGRPRPSAVTCASVIIALVLVAVLVVGIVCRVSVLCAIAWGAVIPLTVLWGMQEDDGY